MLSTSMKLSRCRTITTIKMLCLRTRVSHRRKKSVRDDHWLQRPPLWQQGQTWAATKGLSKLDFSVLDWPLLFQTNESKVRKTAWCYLTKQLKRTISRKRCNTSQTSQAWETTAQKTSLASSCSSCLNIAEMVALHSSSTLRWLILTISVQDTRDLTNFTMDHMDKKFSASKGSKTPCPE